MKSIASIHMVESVVASFDQILRREIGMDLAVHNLWDDYLANDPSEKGEFTADNRNRLPPSIKVQELTGADLIVTTRSTLIPTAEMIRPFIKVLAVAINNAMVKASVTYGERVLVMATVGSTAHPTVPKIEREGETAGKKLSTNICMCAQASRALKAMDMEKHDQILMEKAEESTGYDCIVLAQASMARLEYEIAAVTGCPVLTSPRLCVEEIRQKLVSLCWGWFFLGEMTVIAYRRPKQDPSVSIKRR